MILVIFAILSSCSGAGPWGQQLAAAAPCWGPKITVSAAYQTNYYNFTRKKVTKTPKTSTVHFILSQFCISSRELSNFSTSILESSHLSLFSSLCQTEVRFGFGFGFIVLSFSGAAWKLRYHTIEREYEYER